MQNGLIRGALKGRALWGSANLLHDRFFLNLTHPLGFKLSFWALEKALALESFLSTIRLEKSNSEFDIVGQRYLPCFFVPSLSVGHYF